jgi:hypothetical protein
MRLHYYYYYYYYYYTVTIQPRQLKASLHHTWLNILEHPLPSSLLRKNIPFSAIFSNTFNFFLSLRHKGWWYPHRSQGRITFAVASPSLLSVGTNFLVTIPYKQAFLILCQRRQQYDWLENWCTRCRTEHGQTRCALRVISVCFRFQQTAYTLQ